MIVFIILALTIPAAIAYVFRLVLLYETKLAEMACKHKWLDKENFEITLKDGSYIGTQFVLQCEKCGEIDHHTIKTTD